MLDCSLDNIWSRRPISRSIKRLDCSTLCGALSFSSTNGQRFQTWKERTGIEMDRFPSRIIAQPHQRELSPKIDVKRCSAFSSIGAASIVQHALVTLRLRQNCTKLLPISSFASSLSLPLSLPWFTSRLPHLSMRTYDPS